MRKRWDLGELVLKQLAKYIGNMELILSQYNPHMYLTQVKILSKFLFIDLEKIYFKDDQINKDTTNKNIVIFLLHQSKIFWH